MAFWLTYAKKIIAKAVSGGFSVAAERSRSREQCLLCERAFPPEFLEQGVCISCRIADEHAHGHQEKDRAGGNGSGSSESSRSTNDLAEAYRILGCKASDSDTQIKRQYRILIKECHVDSLPKDLPAYLRDAANQRFRQVQESYEIIMKSRKG